MTIGEVSKKYQLSTDTLRYYEKIGLLNPVPKENGKRNYQEDDLHQLEFVLCMKNAGLMLEDIIHFITLSKEGDKTAPERLQILLHQQEKLKQELIEKQKTLDYLNYKIDLYRKKVE